MRKKGTSEKKGTGQIGGAAFLLERTEAKRRRKLADPQEAVALAREMGGLALALEQAGAY